MSRGSRQFSTFTPGRKYKPRRDHGRNRGKPPTWHATLNGVRFVFHEWTKSEVRARLKEKDADGVLPAGIGADIIQVK